MPAFAEEDFVSEQPVVLAADGNSPLIAAEADEETPTETTTATEAETSAETEEVQETPTPEVQSADSRELRLPLMETADGYGLQIAEDGSANFLFEGKAQAGMFSVTPDYVMGDVTGDGSANSSDATLLLRASASSALGSDSACDILAKQSDNIATSYQAQLIADTNLDGAVNAADATLLLVRAAKSGTGVDMKPLGYTVYVADADGKLQKGWITLGGKTYYAGEDFRLFTGWNQIDGQKFYFGDDCHVAKNELVTVDGKTCYFNDASVPLTNGWAEYDGAKHYFDENGTAVKGLQLIDGQYYAFDKDGGVVIGWLRLGDTLRYSDESGVLVSGLQTIDGVKFWFDEAGVAHNGWIQDGEKVRYADQNGRLLTGEQTIDGEVYHFNAEGILFHSGWVNEDGVTKYLDDNGSYLKGIYKIGDARYAFDDDGSMIVGWIQSGGKKYYAAEDGKLAAGMFTVNGNTVYFEPETCQMVTGWYKINDSKYYFNDDGIMATGMQYIEGVVYNFTNEGKLIQRSVKICLDAGHAGKHNHSPVNPDYWESDFTWTYHLILADALRSHGIEVITTRNDKYTDPSLESRGKTAVGCDLFLSIHSNAAGNDANCNTAMDGPLACCNVDGSTNVLGQRLADTIAQVMQTDYPGTILNRVGDYGLDWYGVLRNSKAVGTPGILLEHSYHTNYRATVWLMDENNLRMMADAEAQVIAEYFGLE
ncbi:MAG: N-acetylmuramoyl-L-alanine amidase [Oscillospiraceae bacterium]|nr:N-acetylmuramoyl-L-alanine amidase [Oscillospiraceae bacterium]